MFSVATDAYDRFMGRYSVPLAPLLADFSSVAKGQRVLDVGCGTGALTAELARRVGVPAVAAVDPSEGFVAVTSARLPGVDVRVAHAEALPFEDGSFDASLAQLVVHFMSDPVAGLGEMRRVTRSGGTVAACVWDHAGGGGPLALFWQVAREVTAVPDDESERAGTGEGQLGDLLRAAGFAAVHERTLAVSVEHTGFDQWWEPFTLGVGPAGVFVAGLDDPTRERLRERCRSRLPAGPFVVTGRAWAARGDA